MFNRIPQTMDQLLDSLLLIGPILLCLTIHELAHGVVAYKLGDETAKREGRLTLNPLKHIDPIGLLMMFIVRFGWAKPVPVNPYNLKKPKRDMALIALAGPVSNFLLAFVILLFQVPVMRLLAGGGAGAQVGSLILAGASISVFFGIFNLLPIPPLDGSKVLFSFLPGRQYGQLMRYERYGSFVLLALIWFGFTAIVLEPIFVAAFELLAFATFPISRLIFGG